MNKLVTDRLILRSWQKSDLEQFYCNSKNIKVGPMAGWKPHESIEESKKILDIFIEKDDTWAIVLKDGGRVIGSLGVHEDSHRQGIEKVYMLGYVLAEEYWGRGYMYEACREVIRFVFEELHAELISVNHFSFNEQSKRVIQKCGFTFEGTMRQAYILKYNGKIFDECLYSMTKDEFLVNRKVNHSVDIHHEMKYSVVKMSRVNARVFVGWVYNPPYNDYTCPQSEYENKIASILDPKGKSYFAVYDSLGDFFGVFEYEFIDSKLQIEFRVRPEMIGKGYGLSFIKECIRFGRMNYDYYGEVQLKIAATNVKTYSLLNSIGFKETKRETEIMYKNEIEFVYMEFDK